MRTLLAAPLALSALALALGGCTTDHDALAVQPPGAGGSGGAPPAVHDSGMPEGDSSPAPSHEAASPVPPGPRKLTLVHGVIDSPWIALCLSRVRGGKVEAPGTPVPALGLEYGSSATALSLPAIDLSTDGILPYVVAAPSPEAVRGLGCRAILDRAQALAAPPPSPGSSAGGAPGSVGPGADAALEDASAPRDAATTLDASLADASVADARVADVAGDARTSIDASVPIPELRASPLPLIPEGALAAAESYLLVAGGCMGGPGVTDPSEQSVCGGDYSPSAPTLTEILVQLPRGGRAGQVELSLLNASPALLQAELVLIPGLHGDPITVAKRVVTGALRPSRPYAGSSAAQIGAGNDGALVRLLANGSTSAAYENPWSRTLSAGGVDALEDGVGYTLVYVGPYPSLSGRRWWNDPLVTIVADDP